MPDREGSAPDRPSSPRQDPRRGLGRRGEEVAARHLVEHGYRILERNHRTATGEIDIVACDGDCLVLVEVRTRRGRRHGTPEESITTAKRARLERLAEEYVQALDRPGCDYRVDVVAIELAASGRLLRVNLVRDALL